MRLQRTLQGKARGSISLDALFDHLNHLSSQTVKANRPGCSSSGVIVEKWQFDGETFDIRFSELANDLLRAADDHHREIIAVLLKEIG